MYLLAVNVSIPLYIKCKVKHRWLFNKQMVVLRLQCLHSFLNHIFVCDVRVYCNLVNMNTFNSLGYKTFFGVEYYYCFTVVCHSYDYKPTGFVVSESVRGQCY